MATVGYWITLVADANFAGGRHDVGTVVETQLGFDTSPPRCKDPAVEAMFVRKFIADSRPPAITPKLHKMDLGVADTLTKAGAEALAAETVKGKAELAAKEGK
jgi:hypothetical protein